MNSRFLRFMVAAAVLGAGLGAPATAQTLYGERAPRDAAYVRLFRAVDGQPGRALALGAARFEALGHGAVSPYRPVAPDIYQIRSDGHLGEIIPRAQRYYTVTVTRGGIQVFEDQAHTDPARAQLVLYNLSSLEQVSLSTEDRRTQVIPPVSPRAAEGITVNAMPVRLGVFSAGRVLRLLGDPKLSRGSSYSALVFDEEGQTAVHWAEAVLVLE